jgi:hypothetical protein
VSEEKNTQPGDEPNESTELSEKDLDHVAGVQKVWLPSNLNLKIDGLDNSCIQPSRPHGSIPRLDCVQI